MTVGITLTFSASLHHVNRRELGENAWVTRSPTFATVRPQPPARLTSFTTVMSGGEMTQRPHGARNRRTVPVPNSQKLEHSRRWHVVIAASLVHALHAASIYLAPAMLMSPMRHDLGLSVAEVALPLNVYRLVQALFLVPAGSVLDRVGPVRALRVSIVAAASLGLLFPLCTNLSQLVVLQALFAVTKLFGGLSAMLMVIARVFGTSAGMGTATSALLGGYSFAGFLVPSVVGSLYQRFGWRVCAGIVAALFACLGLPLTFCYLREDDQVAEMAGVQVERKKEDIHSSQISKSIVAQPSFSKPLFTPQYTYLASVIAAFSFSMHIVLDHFLVFLREDLAMSFEVGTKFISALNLLALVSKLAVGPLADNYDKGMLMLVFSVLGMLSSLLLFDVTAVGAFITTTSIYKVISFIPLYAIGYAAVFSLTTSSLGEFGSERFGLRSNTNLMILFGSGSIGSYTAGFLRTQYGSYLLPFVCNTLAWVFTCMASIGYIRSRAHAKHSEARAK